MNWHYIEKAFYDYADDIEGVNIHYVWTPMDRAPDWEAQRITRFMPLVRSAAPLIGPGQVTILPQEPDDPEASRLRKKVLKLPERLHDPERQVLTDRYLLHHYFEIFQDGHRYYSPLFTEEIVTGAGNQVDVAVPAPSTPPQRAEAVFPAPAFIDLQDAEGLPPCRQSGAEE